MGSNKENIIVDKTFHFSLEIIDCTEILRSLKKFEMVSQLFKSRTSIGRMLGKLKISAKEADETSIGLNYVEYQSTIPTPNEPYIRSRFNYSDYL